MSTETLPHLSAASTTPRLPELRDDVVALLQLLLQVRHLLLVHCHERRHAALHCVTVHLRVSIARDVSDARGGTDGERRR